MKSTEGKMPDCEQKTCMGRKIRASALIIDDDDLWGQALKEQLQHIAVNFNIILDSTVISDPVQCLQDGKRYDIYFVDVKMPKLSGIDLVKRLQEKYIDAEFVFVSAYEQYIREAIYARPSAFVRKEYLQEDLFEAFSYLEKNLEIKTAIICVKDHLRDVFIKPGEITYLKSEGHYVYLYGTDGKVMVIRNNLKTVQKELEAFDFLRIHLRYSVNLNYLEDYRRTQICVRGNIWLPISDPYIKDVSEKIINWAMTRR